MTKTPEKIQNFIDGQFVEPLGGRYLDNVEPATGKAYSQVADSDARDVDLAVAAAENAFIIRNLNKVYIHSRDINIRNINLNSRFGFELEGVFLDDITVGDKHQDVVRMALFKPLWLQIFSPGVERTIQ